MFGNALSERGLLAVPYPTSELVEDLRILVDTIEAIFDDSGRHYEYVPTGSKLLLHVYDATSLEPRAGAFQQTPDVMENALLQAAFLLGAQSVQQQDPALARRLRDVAHEIDLRAWFDAESQTFFWGKPGNPAAGVPIDRIVSEARLVVYMARLTGAIDDTEAKAVLKGLFDQSARGPSGFFLPATGTAQETTCFMFLTNAIEDGTAFGTALRQLEEAQIAAANSRGFPLAATGTSGEGARYFDFANSPAEFETPYPDSDVLVGPAAACGIATGLEASVDNFHEVVSRQVASWDERYGMPHSLDMDGGVVGGRPLIDMFVSSLAFSSLAAYHLGPAFVDDAFEEEFEGFRDARHALRAVLKRIRIGQLLPCRTA